MNIMKFINDNQIKYELSKFFISEVCVKQVTLRITRYLRTEVGTCGPHEYLIWPASNFSLPKLEHNIA